jgi:hypothetical protein
MIVIAAVAASLVALVPPPAGAHHLPTSCCSESGDLCQSTRRLDGVRKLGVLLAAKYFRVFHLCVTDPDGYASCVPFQTGGTTMAPSAAMFAGVVTSPPPGPAPIR